MTELKEATNKQILEELGKRIILKRLELEGVKHDGVIRMVCDGKKTHYFDISDNEWKDTTKSDYTGAKWTLTFALSEAKNKSFNELTD